MSDRINPAIDRINLIKKSELSTDQKMVLLMVSDAIGSYKASYSMKLNRLIKETSIKRTRLKQVINSLIKLNLLNRTPTIGRNNIWDYSINIQQLAKPIYPTDQEDTPEANFSDDYRQSDVRPTPVGRPTYCGSDVRRTVGRTSDWPHRPMPSRFTVPPPAANSQQPGGGPSPTERHGKQPTAPPTFHKPKPAHPTRLSPEILEYRNILETRSQIISSARGRNITWEESLLNQTDTDLLFADFYHTYLINYSSEEAAEVIAAELGGMTLSWSKILKYDRRAGLKSRILNRLAVLNEPEPEFKQWESPEPIPFNPDSLTPELRKYYYDSEGA